MSTNIKTTLPFCLYSIDERVFILKDDLKTEVKFKKFKKEPSIRTAHSQNTEFVNDRWGIDACSKIEVKTEKKFTDAEEAKKFALKIINRFIRLYRFFDKEAVHLTTLSLDDLFNFDYLQDKEDVVVLSFGGGIRPINQIKYKEISDVIENALKENYKAPFWQELLLNSEYYIFIGDYRMAVLETVIALELVLSEFIRRKGREKNIPEKDIDEFIKNVGLTGNIKTTIKLLIDSLPEEKVLTACTSGITIRNSIVHKGREEVNFGEAKESLEAVKKIIEFLSVVIK